MSGARAEIVLGFPRAAAAAAIAAVFAAADVAAAAAAGASADVDVDAAVAAAAIGAADVAAVFAAADVTVTAVADAHVAGTGAHIAGAVNVAAVRRSRARTKTFFLFCSNYVVCVHCCARPNLT